MARYTWRNLIEQLDIRIVPYRNQKPYLTKVSIYRPIYFILKMRNIDAHAYHLEDYLVQNNLFNLFNEEHIYTKDLFEDDLILHISEKDRAIAIPINALICTVGTPLNVAFSIEVEDEAIEPNLSLLIKFSKTEKESTSQILTIDKGQFSSEDARTTILPNGETLAEYFEEIESKLIRSWEQQLTKHLLKPKATAPNT